MDYMLLTDELEPNKYYVEACQITYASQVSACYKRRDEVFNLDSGLGTS